MIKKLNIVLLYAVCGFTFAATAHDEFDAQEELSDDAIVTTTKAVKVNKFQEEMRSKLEELEEMNTIIASQVQELAEADARRDTNMINLRDILLSISSYRSQSVAEITELKERCRSLELRLDNQNKKAKKWAFAGCVVTAAVFLAYEAWLYKTKMGKKAK